MAPFLFLKTIIFRHQNCSLPSVAKDSKPKDGHGLKLEQLGQLILTQKIKPQYLLQVKIIFRYVFQPQLILNFLCLLALIIHELGLADKGN